ncbi:MAG: class III signal peptide-containing protein [Candidatus Omnitrophota bacterium]
MRKKGQTALEYALLVTAAIAAMLVFSWYLGRAVKDKTNAFEDEMISLPQPSPSP